MAAGSQKPTFKDYNVKPVCVGCGRKLVAKNEMAMWFIGHPHKAVYGLCCWDKAA
jgi:hypothetical protein